MRRVPGKGLKVMGRTGHPKENSRGLSDCQQRNPILLVCAECLLASVDLEGGRLQLPPFIQVVFTPLLRIGCVPGSVLVKLSLTSRCSHWREKNRAPLNSVEEVLVRNGFGIMLPGPLLEKSPLRWVRIRMGCRKTGFSETWLKPRCCSESSRQWRRLLLWVQLYHCWEWNLFKIPESPVFYKYPLQCKYIEYWCEFLWNDDITPPQKQGKGGSKNWAVFPDLAPPYPALTGSLASVPPFRCQEQEKAMARCSATALPFCGLYW